MTTHTTDKISAADTSIGFDYQFYYFFYLLLRMKTGEIIGLEVKDDIHIQFDNGRILLIQTKHSVQSKPGGGIINLRPLDIDLWKTMSNWIKITNEQPDPKAWLTKTRFSLVTNKQVGKNAVLEKIREFQKESLSIQDVKDYLKKLKNSTTDIKLREHIDVVLKMKNSLLSIFLKAIDFDINEDNLIDRIKRLLVEMYYPADRIEDIYNSLHSELRDKNYLKVKKGDVIEYSFDDFYKNFRHCFKVGVTYKLPIRELPIVLPSSPENQNFIKQLIDIDAVDIAQKEEIVDLTTYMLMVLNNFSRWIADGDLGESERKKFDRNTILIWKSIFDKQHRNVTELVRKGKSIKSLEREIKKSALACLDEIRQVPLTIEGTDLEAVLSNGYYYLLNENKNIGWHFDWKNKYK